MDNMKKIMILLAVLVGLVAIAGCTQPTIQPTVQPSPSAIPSGQAPTSKATPAPAIEPFPGGYAHSLYGYFMNTGDIRATRQAEWRGQPISAAGEVYAETKANETLYMGYMQADGSYLIDGIPAGNDVRIVSVKLYASTGDDLTITVNSGWQPFNEVAQRTRTDIG
jgi:hypothetical protein